MMGWLQDHRWLVGVIVAAALALAGLAWRAARRRPPATPVPGAAARRRVDVSFAAAVVITLAVGWAAVLWLLGKADQVPAGKDRATAQADAVRTGAAIALGTGGAAYLLLAYRRQRLEEVDTRERRITELFTKAVEELGHEKAPVRLGALYSLERLAQNNPEHRQTVVDVFCAYLRMPYTLPAPTKPGAEQIDHAAPPAEDGIPAAHPASGRGPAQEELQVRQTAQRILAAHLQRPQGTSGTKAQRRQPSPQWAFWPGISLDLIGAALVNVDFAGVSVIQARFVGAAFQGDTWFSGAAFQGDVWFDDAAFQRNAWFKGVAFQGNAGFTEATFQRDADFDKATFPEGWGPQLAGAYVLHLDDPDYDERRLWPDGLTVRPDPADPTRGTLVRSEQVEEPESAVPPSDRPADTGGTG
jgi:Pentapeptide repeats (9 copies)